MAIKVEIPYIKKEVEKPFPKLMICTADSTDKGMIVLFKEKNQGTILKVPDGSSSKVGEYAYISFMRDYEDYNEPITIQNL